MIRTISYGIDVLLVVFLAREVWQFRRRYRRLEEEVAAGHHSAPTVVPVARAAVQRLPSAAT